MRTCGYCDGECVQPPPRFAGDPPAPVKEDLEKPYACMKCHRRLKEQETVNKPELIGSFDL